MAAGTEVGKYRLLAVFFLPLYTRLRREEVLDNETRGMIRGCVYADPGIHYHEILRRLRLPNGKAAHHLMTLEREGYIRSRNDGRLKRFYPVDMKIGEASPMLDRFQRAIYDAMREKDGMSQREIARALDVSFTSVNKHINRMASMGVVLLVRKGMSVRCYLVNGHEPGKSGEEQGGPPAKDPSAPAR